MPVPHPSLEPTGIVCLLGAHWPRTSQGQPPLHTSARQALHNLGTSSSAHYLGTAQTGRRWGEEPLLPGGLASRHPPVGRKGASELQELRADKRPGCVQGKEP